jgi:hypothetical protein
LFDLSRKNAGFKPFGDRCGEGNNLEEDSNSVAFSFDVDDLNIGMVDIRGPGVGTNDGS